jgi:hypothetical protein
VLVAEEFPCFAGASADFVCDEEDVVFLAEVVDS